MKTVWVCERCDAAYDDNVLAEVNVNFGRAQLWCNRCLEQVQHVRKEEGMAHVRVQQR